MTKRMGSKTEPRGTPLAASATCVWHINGYPLETEAYAINFEFHAKNEGSIKRYLPYIHIFVALQYFFAINL